MKNILELIEELAEEGQEARLDVGVSLLSEIEMEPTRGAFCATLCDNDGMVLLDRNGDKFLKCWGATPTKAVVYLDTLCYKPGWADKIQKLAIAMDAELGWTPEECNNFGCWEDARDTFLAEHLEEWVPNVVDVLCKVREIES